MDRFPIYMIRIVLIGWDHLVKSNANQTGYIHYKNDTRQLHITDTRSDMVSKLEE